MRQGGGRDEKEYERQNTTHGQFSVEMDGRPGHGPLQAAEGV